MIHILSFVAPGTLLVLLRGGVSTLPKKELKLLKTFTTTLPLETTCVLLILYNIVQCRHIKSAYLFIIEWGVWDYCRVELTSHFMDIFMLWKNDSSNDQLHFAKCIILQPTISRMVIYLEPYIHQTFLYLSITSLYGVWGAL